MCLRISIYTVFSTEFSGIRFFDNIKERDVKFVLVFFFWVNESRNEQRLGWMFDRDCFLRRGMME